MFLSTSNNNEAFQSFKRSFISVIKSCYSILLISFASFQSLDGFNKSIAGSTCCALRLQLVIHDQAERPEGGQATQGHHGEHPLARFYKVCCTIQRLYLESVWERTHSQLGMRYEEKALRSLFLARKKLFPARFQPD